MSSFFEIAMIILFGLSWPNNIIKSLKTKSTKGKSIVFLLLIDLGYVCGIVAKLLSDSFLWYVLFFYVLNFVMVTADILFYFYYMREESKAQSQITA